MKENERILVALVDGEELALPQAKTFNDVDRAKQFFIKLIKLFPELADGMTQEDFESAFEDCYWANDTHYSIVVKIIQTED